MALNRGAFRNFEPGTQVWNPVADKTKEIEVRFEIYRDIDPLFSLSKFHIHNKNLFWVISTKNNSISLNRGVLPDLASGTQLWDHVADKVNDIEVWDLKYAETYTLSIDPKSFIYIAIICFDL